MLLGVEPRVETHIKVAFVATEGKVQGDEVRPTGPGSFLHHEVTENV